MILADLDAFETNPDELTEQFLLYPMDTIPSFEYEPFSKPKFSPDDCLAITGVMVNGRKSFYSHVIRQIAKSSEGLPTKGNEPHLGGDKLVFFNFDQNGEFHWQAVYSTALFLRDDYQITKT